MVIVESELDAILIQQEAADLVCSVALGGFSKKTDTQLHEWIKQASVILLSLDFDDPGKKRYSFWMRQYPTSALGHRLLAKVLGTLLSGDV